MTSIPTTAHPLAPVGAGGSTELAELDYLLFEIDRSVDTPDGPKHSPECSVTELLSFHVTVQQEAEAAAFAALQATAIANRLARISELALQNAKDLAHPPTPVEAPPAPTYAF